MCPLEGLLQRDERLFGQNHEEDHNGWSVGWLLRYNTALCSSQERSLPFGPRILYPLGIIDSPRVTSELQIKKIRSFMTNTNHLLSGSNGNTLCIDVLPFGHLANTFTQSRLQ